MVKIELILDESRLTDAEAKVLSLEAQVPGAMSKPLLKAVVGGAMIDTQDWLVCKIAPLEAAEDGDLRDVILFCPIPAGMTHNEIGMNCDECARHEPLRADLCHHIWPHHWDGTMIKNIGFIEEETDETPAF